MHEVNSGANQEPGVGEPRIALVTGGSMGIGQGIAARLVRDHYDVVVVGRNGDRLAAAARGLGPQAFAVQGDVGCVADVERIAAAVRKRYGRLDLLVNNAGIYEPAPLGAPLAELERAFDLIIDAGLKGAFLMAHVCASLLVSPGGRIVNIGSIVGKDGGSVPGYSAYACAKAGIHGLTMALARDFAGRRITVNTVAPGFVEETGQTLAFDAERVATIAAAIPLGRPATVEDVAGAVAWLASQDASYATGTTVALTGGWRIH